MSDPPRKPLWKLLAIGVAVFLLVAVAVLLAFSWWTSGQLDRRVAAIRAAGDPASIGDLDPGPIPADDNAAVVLASLADQLDAFSREYGQFFNTPLGREYEKTRNEGQTPSSDQLAAIRAILDKHASLASGLAKAAECTDYVPVGEYSLDSNKFLEVQIKRSNRLRTASRYLIWQMTTLNAEGHPEQAIERGVELLTLARLAENEPLLVSYLVTLALRMGVYGPLYDALAAGPIPRELHVALDAELARADQPDRYSRMLRTERAFAISAFDDLTRQGNAVATQLARVATSRQRGGVLDYYEELLRVADEPWYANSSQRAAGGVFVAPTKFGVMTDLLVSSLQSAYEIHQRDLAVQRSLRIFNALRQFAETNDREAQGLADLGLPPAATTDPFDGQPLRLKKRPAGWIIYSVGKNGVDDGGDVNQQKDYSVGPRQHRAD